MIYITQLIYIREGMTDTFHEFENMALPLLEKYGGKLLLRVRPDRSAVIAGESEPPYEIHFISFDDENDLSRFMKDDSRRQFVHLKDASVREMLLVKGERV